MGSIGTVNVKAFFFFLPKQDVRELKDQRDLLEFELEEMSQLSVSLHESKFRVLQIITVKGTIMPPSVSSSYSIALVLFQ